MICHLCTLFSKLLKYCTVWALVVLLLFNWQHDSAFAIQSLCLFFSMYFIYKVFICFILYVHQLLLIMSNILLPFSTQWNVFKIYNDGGLSNVIKYLANVTVSSWCWWYWAMRLIPQKFFSHLIKLSCYKIDFSFWICWNFW